MRFCQLTIPGITQVVLAVGVDAGLRAHTLRHTYSTRPAPPSKPAPATSAGTAEQAAVIETVFEQQIGRTHKRRFPTPEPPRSTRPTSNVARAGASRQSPPPKARSPTPAKRSRRTTKVRGDPRTCCTRSPTLDVADRTAAVTVALERRPLRMNRPQSAR